MLENPWPGRILAIFVWLAVVFLVVPQLIVVLVSFNSSARMVVTWSDWSLRWYQALAAHEGFAASFTVSLLLAPVVACCAVLLGAAASYGLARFVRRGAGFYEAIFVAPLLLPATALAVAMFLFLYTLGLTNTIWAVLISHVVIALPYAFRTMLASFNGIDWRLEEAAMSLGASRATAIRRVTLPLVRPGIAAATLFCFIVSLDEITVTLFVGGRQIKTVPIQIFDQTEYGMDPTVAAASTVLIVFSALAIVLLVKTIGLGKAYQIKR